MQPVQDCNYHFLSPLYVKQFHPLVKLASVSRDILQFFIYDKEKEKAKIAEVNFFVSYFSSKPKNLVEFRPC